MKTKSNVINNGFVEEYFTEGKLSVAGEYFNLKLIVLLFLIPAFYSCRSPQTGKSDSASAGGESVNPMECRIRGQIVEIMETRDADTSSLCHKHPCMAKVKILEVRSCGPAVSISPVEGDTVEIRFANSLVNNSTPENPVKATYPGLKKGDQFIAAAEQRLATGSQGSFIIFDYRR